MTSTNEDRPGVVVGVDGSPGSAVAVQWAARDAGVRGAPLTLVHVVPPTAGHWRESAVLPAWLHARREMGRRLLDDAQRAVTAEHVELRTSSRMLSAHAVHALVELSKSADLVVVGCLGAGTLRGRHLGSVSAGLTHYAHSPVAVIHEGTLPAVGSSAPVLVGVDGSPGAQAALAVAFEEAGLRGTSVLAVHAWKEVGVFDSVVSVTAHRWPELYAKEEAVVDTQLAPWRERYPDVPVVRVIKRGDPAETLVDVSASAQLAVVGSHGSGGFAGMLLGSVSAAAVLLARIPVIVAR